MNSTYLKKANSKKYSHDNQNTLFHYIYWNILIVAVW